MKTVASFRSGRGIRNVTVLPAFLLKLMGRYHAGRDIAVAEAYIQKLREKCITLENREVLAAEKILFNARTEAGVLLSTVSKSRKSLGSIPAPIPEKDALSIRSNKMNNGIRSSAVSSLSSSLDRLTQINELIIDVDTCLEQRVLKTRHLCSEKVNAYVMGIRCVNNGFSYDKEYDNVALDRYNARHDKGDTAIESAVASIYGGGRSNESL